MLKKLLVASCVLVILAGSATARTRLKNICRIKGQEENVLRGMGLVVGLNGTGAANDGPTMRAIARAMEIMGNPVTNPGDQYLRSSGQIAGLDELKKIKNVALVIVTATVPATGARRGDHVDCFVSALNGKSLEGGRLAFASLQGPNTQDPRVYALCQGPVMIDNAQEPMVGVVHGGCQMEADIFTPFYRDGYITLILDKNHADFQTANDIVQLIREKVFFSETHETKGTEDMVRAIDAANIVVRIPDVFARDPVFFASELMEIQLEEPQTESRVVINQRAGTIVISGDVEIGDVIVAHKNVTVEAEASPTFAAIDVDHSSAPKLEELVNQLNSLKVPTADMIEIIRGIERNGKLHGRLIIEQ
jgi:flagellar P-ring protein precursor FlgI